MKTKGFAGYGKLPGPRVLNPVEIKRKSVRLRADRRTPIDARASAYNPLVDANPLWCPFMTSGVAV